jgi:uncharacterized lipoprotein YddW (UPF0748 family)
MKLMRAAQWGVILSGMLLAWGGLLGCRNPEVSSSPMFEQARHARQPVSRSAPRPLPQVERAVWVARFHYRYPDDVRTIIRNCADMGVNTVLWQVRGAGTVAYPSRLEPWLEEFGFTSPGFDPLALAVEEAHRRGLRIEAWVNILPGWRGPKPPPLRDQLWNARPEWFLQDSRGQRQPLGDFYLILNPCLPEVRQHIGAIIDEIVSNYDVDGIHMDYVRYAWDTTPGAEKRYPRDERTLSIYWNETGKRPEDDSASWKHWRANQLTRLVADIRNIVNCRRPGATLTAAVFSDPHDAYNQFFQNGVGWLRAGMVDALMPMAYTDKLGEFEKDVEAYRQLGGRGRIIPGLGIYKHATAAPMRQQLAYCVDCGGDWALFSYGSLWPTHEDRLLKKGPSAKEQAARAIHRDVLGEFTGRDFQ